jgi:hypothetical protein
MLKELIRHLGGTQARIRNLDDLPIPDGKACENVSSRSGDPRQGNPGRPANGAHRDWRPRLYW